MTSEVEVVQERPQRLHIGGPTSGHRGARRGSDNGKVRSGCRGKSSEAPDSNRTNSTQPGPVQGQPGIPPGQQGTSLGRSNLALGHVLPETRDEEGARDGSQGISAELPKAVAMLSGGLLLLEDLS